MNLSEQQHFALSFVKSGVRTFGKVPLPSPASLSHQPLADLSPKDGHLGSFK